MYSWINKKLNTCKRNSGIFEYYKQKISDFLQIIYLVKNLFPVNPRKSLIKLVQTFPFVLRKKIVEFLSEILLSLESSLKIPGSRGALSNLQNAASPVYEAPGTKCNSVYRYERQSVQAQHDSLDWNTLPR